MVTAQVPHNHRVANHLRSLGNQKPLVSLHDEAYIRFAQAVECARGRAVQFTPAPSGSTPANLNGFPAYVQTDHKNRHWYCINGITTANGRQIPFILKVLTHKSEAFRREFLFGCYKAEGQAEYTPLLFYRSSGTNRGYDAGRWRITALQVFAEPSAFANKSDVEELFSATIERRSEGLERAIGHYSFAEFKPVLFEGNGSNVLCFSKPTDNGKLLIYKLFKPQEISGLRIAWFMKESVNLENFGISNPNEFMIMRGDVLLSINEFLHAVAQVDSSVQARHLDVETLWRKGLLTVILVESAESVGIAYQVFASSEFHKRTAAARETLGSFGVE